MEKINKILVMVLIQTALVIGGTSAFAGGNGKEKGKDKTAVKPVPTTTVGAEPTDETESTEKKTTPVAVTSPSPEVPISNAGDLQTQTLDPVKANPVEMERINPMPAKKLPVDNSNLDSINKKVISTVANPIVADPVVADPVVADPVATNPVVTAKNPCADDVLKNILSALNGRDPNILGLLYEMTALRLARQAKSDDPKHKTLEDLASKQLAGLKKNFDATPGAEGVKARIDQIYKDYGLKSDVAELNKFTGAGGSVKPCYWNCKGSRFLNQHSSAYALALSFTDQSSSNANLRVTEADAAVISAVEKIRDTAAQSDSSYAPGTEKGNLMQMSNRVARYLGAIAGGENLSKDELESRLDADSAHLEIAVADATETARSAYIDCLKLDPKIKDCASCLADQTAKFEAPGMSEVIKGLLKKVAGNGKIEIKDLKGLKGVANDVDFDLKNFAKGVVAAYKCISPTVKNPCPPYNRIACKDYSKTGVTASQYTKITYEKRAEELKAYNAKKASVQSVPTSSPSAVQESAPVTELPQSKVVTAPGEQTSDQTQVVSPEQISAEVNNVENDKNIGVTVKKLDKASNKNLSVEVPAEADTAAEVKSPALLRLEEQFKHKVKPFSNPYKKVEPQSYDVGISPKVVEEQRKQQSAGAQIQKAPGILLKNALKKDTTSNQSEFVKEQLENREHQEKH